MECMLSPAIRKRQRDNMSWTAGTPACFSNDILQSRCPSPKRVKSAIKLVRNELLTLKMLDISESELAAIFTEDDFKADYRILNREVRKLGYNIPPLVSKRLRVYTLHNSKKAVTAD